MTMTTFDVFLIHFGTIYAFYLVYVNTPFRKDVDEYVSNFFQRINERCPFMQKVLYVLNLINEMNLSLTIDYSDYEKLFIEDEHADKTKQDINKDINHIETKFEEKYIDKMKQFPEDYYFSQEETELIKKNSEQMRVDKENERRKKMEDIMGKLEHIHSIIYKVNQYGGPSSQESIDIILNFHEMELHDDHDDDIKMIKELFQQINEEQSSLEQELYELENEDLSLEIFEKKAYHDVLEKKLTSLMNNYVCEHTPLGNVFMRYNNEKCSFEYFSNSTIPYRYLEPIGRKYVMTYHCKPLFVDLEEELKKSEEKRKQKEQEQKKEEQKKEEEKQTKSSSVFANFRKYNNKDTHAPIVSSQPSKNRASTSGNLPSHMKVNLPNVNNVSEKMVLKEHANRYTYEGRLSNLSLLKKINRKLVDKKYAMTFAEFKKMQEQNKKSS